MVHLSTQSKSRKISQLPKYLQFVEKLFEEEPEIARNFENGFDIIKVRQLFLQSLNETNGMNLLSIDSELSDQLKNLALANGNEG